jgi:hypothetical protein
VCDEDVHLMCTASPSSRCARVLVCGSVCSRLDVLFDEMLCSMTEYKVNIETLFTVEASSMEEVMNEVRLTLEKAEIKGLSLDFTQWNAYILIEDEEGAEQYEPYD